jgi:hypothetical protein
MADKKSKLKHKRLSKGQRTHVRRMKQAARKEGPLPGSSRNRRSSAEVN